MISKNKQVDRYLKDGCGRCKLAGTPQCKVNNWLAEMCELRTIVLACGLSEELKWGVPCYTSQDKNVLVLAAFKEYCAISFFKGAYLRDEKKILTKPGENTQAARQIRFTNLKEIVKSEATLKAYIKEAIAIEKAGLKVELKKPTEYKIPVEFQHALDQSAALNKSFHALTPGRQRAYILFFSAPKQTKTRESRIDKSVEQILKGKGLNE